MSIITSYGTGSGRELARQIEEEEQRVRVQVRRRAAADQAEAQQRFDERLQQAAQPRPAPAKRSRPPEAGVSPQARQPLPTDNSRGAGSASQRPDAAPLPAREPDREPRQEASACQSAQVSKRQHEHQSRFAGLMSSMPIALAERGGAPLRSSSSLVYQPAAAAREHERAAQARQAIQAGSAIGLTPEATPTPTAESVSLAALSQRLEHTVHSLTGLGTQLPAEQLLNELQAMSGQLVATDAAESSWDQCAQSRNCLEFLAGYFEPEWEKPGIGQAIGRTVQSLQEQLAQIEQLLQVAALSTPADASRRTRASGLNRFSSGGLEHGKTATQGIVDAAGVADSTDLLQDIPAELAGGTTAAGQSQQTESIGVGAARDLSKRQRETLVEVTLRSV